MISASDRENAVLLINEAIAVTVSELQKGLFTAGKKGNQI